MAENPTDNHDLDRPLVGSDTGRDSENWGSELNNNFAVIDNKLVVVDTDANVGNYTPTSNGLYYAYDTGQWYRGNGSEWVSDDTSGPSPSFDSVSVSNGVTANDVSTSTLDANTTSTSSIDSDDVTVSNHAVQSALDGAVVPIASGKGVADVIDIDSSSEPIQEAIDIIESVGVSADGRYGAGTVLLPPGTTQTPGGIHTLAGKRIIGWGREASIVEVTDTAANCFSLGGNGGNVTKAYLDGFTIHGGNRSDRTAGSAINATATESDSSTTNMITVGFNIGQLQFQSWGGPDPVIRDFGAFSSTWRYLRAQDYDGTFLHSQSGFHNNIGMINVNHDGMDDLVLNLETQSGVMYMNSINIGGDVGRALRYAPPYSRYSGLHIGHINIEPDSDHGGTLSSAEAPIELYGSAPTSIKSISQSDALTSDYTVVIGENLNDDGNNPGAGNNKIGTILYNDAASKTPVGVVNSVRDPSWFWGTKADITYNGHQTSSCYPLFNLVMSGDKAFTYTPRSSVPASPTAGMVAVQDGTNWNPTGSGSEDLVVYLNGGWTNAT